MREDASLHTAPAAPRRARAPALDPVIGQPAIVFFDAALLRDGDDDWRGYVAAHLKLWPGGLRAPGSREFVRWVGYTGVVIAYPNPLRPSPY